MKIGIIGPQLNCKSVNKNKTMSQPTSTFVGNFQLENKIPASAYLSNSAISFGIKLPGSEFTDIPCGYCMDKMIHPDIFNSIKWPEKTEIIPVKEIIKNFKKRYSQLSVNERSSLFEAENLNILTPNNNLRFGELVSKLQNPPKSFLKINDIREVPQEVYNSKILNVLDSFESYMHDEQKIIFKAIKKLNAQSPETPFHELLKIFRPEHLEKLKTKEFVILNDIQKTVNTLFEGDKPASDIEIKKAEAQKAINYILEESSYLIKTQNGERPFKRKAFIGKLQEIGKTLPDNEVMKEIIYQGRKLPDSQSDISAFIVKYSSRAKDKKTGEWHHRSSQEIAHNIIYPSLDTRDHINARNPLDGGVAGATKKYNLLHTCARCNHHKENDEFDYFIDKTPMAKKSIQYQTDYFIDKTNRGLMHEGAEYIKDYSKTIEDSTNGKFVVDISKLNENIPTNNESTFSSIIKAHRRHSKFRNRNGNSDNETKKWA